MKYVLSFFVWLLIFVGVLGFCFGSGGDECISQGYEECPDGCHFDSNCECKNDGNGLACSDPTSPAPPATPAPPAQNQSCEIQPDASGYCLAGYKNVSSCCELACPGTGYLSGDINSEYTCESCIEGETIPNANHTKCVCDSNFKCCGIKLNTVVPFIGDCIEMNTDSSRSDTTSVTSVTAFPILMQGLMKILMSAIMIFSFLMVIIAGLMMTAGPFSSGSFSKGKTILKNVIISLILLGCSGLILSLINPSFFGG